MGRFEQSYFLFKVERETDKSENSQTGLVMAVGVAGLVLGIAICGILYFIMICYKKGHI